MPCSFKNILTGYKFKFIKREEYLKLYNQYTQDILAAQRNIPNSEMSKYSTKEYMEKIFRVGGTTQKLSIVYKTGDNTSVSYEECDSVGFILTLTPFSVHTSKNKSVFMFSMKEVGTRHPDKIAEFLVSKLE